MTDTRRAARGGAWLAAAAVALLLAAPGPARAAMSADQVKRAIAERFGVEVLRVAEATEDGRAVYRVTVMNPGGTFNEAFQVNVLVVDRETGELVPQFRHRASGYDLPGALDRDPNRNPESSLRSNPWR